MLEQISCRLNHLRTLAAPPLRISDCAALIQHYARTKSLLEGKCFHEELKNSFDRIDPFLSNFLILMYGNCGSVADARSTFESIEQRNVFSWNMLVTAYARNGHLSTAEIILEKFPEHCSIAMNTTITAHANSGSLDRAKKMFQKMPVADVVAWTALIAGHTIAGHHAQSIQLFRAMCLGGVMPDRVALISILEACDCLRDARSIHSIILEAGLIGDPQICSALLTAYGRNRRLELATSIFQAMQRRELVSWNAMISAAAKNGDLALARDLFSRMPERDVISWTALFAEVAQTGELDQAKHLFDRIPERNDIAWNAMIAAYAQNGHGEEALEIFRTMDLEGVFPNRATFVSTLDACTISKSSAKMGRFLLAELRCLGYHGGDIRLDTARINLLGKIGSLAAAVEIFAGVIDKNDICWNSMIAAYATNGHIEEAMASLSAMTLDGFHPNEITFRIVLGALSHAGLMDPSWDLFVSSARDYSIRPAMEHYVCIVDLLARVGRLSEARDLIARMPFHPDPVAWTALLGACKLQEERDLGEFAAAMLVQLNSENDSPYVVLSHLYSKDG